jgi:hypothetical protein
MLANSTSSNNFNTDNPIYVLQIFCVLPELFNLIFLSCGLYGMYQGIEISHPLYAVLFLNLIAPLLTTMLDIIAFFFASTASYIILSNIMNTLSLLFHCTSWCVTSVLRFIYIIYGDWFNNLIWSQKLQCTAAVVMTLTLTAILSIPSFVVLIFYGKSLSTSLLWTCSLFQCVTVETSLICC